MATGLFNYAFGGLKTAVKAVAQAITPQRPKAVNPAHTVIKTIPARAATQMLKTKVHIRRTPSVAKPLSSAIIKTTTHMPTPKGTIKPQSKLSGALSGALTGALGQIPVIGGAISGAISGTKATVLPTGQVILHRKKHRGLTYNEIKGATKLLRLVKRFAPAGHHTALKIRKHRHVSY